MTITAMTATFGCLDNAALTLRPGLNLLEQPNEGGKSTWCAFLRAMFYGLESRKGGAASERNRYTPWSGAPMAGTVELTWQGRAVTLRRFPKGTNPFGGFQAVYTGTEEPVPGLTADNVGESILGVNREVFTRTSFIFQGGMRVDKSGDLERRVAALATSGEEDVSFTQTEATLRTWRNARQANKSTGSIPKLRSRLESLDQQITRLDQARSQAQEAQTVLDRLEEERHEVLADLARHTARQAAAYRSRYEKAKSDLDQARQSYRQFQQEAAGYGPLPSPQALTDAQGTLTYLRTLTLRRQESGKQLTQALEEVERTRQTLEGAPFSGLTGDQAVTRAEEVAQAVSAPHKAHFSHWVPLLGCAAAATALLAAGLVTQAIHMAVLLGVGGGLLAAGCLVSILLSALGRKKESRMRRDTLAAYGVNTPQALLSAAQGYARRWAAFHEAEQTAQLAQRDLDSLAAEYDARWQSLQTFVAPFAPAATDPVTLTAAVSRALTLEDKSQRLRRELDAAQAVWEAASAQGEPADTPEPDLPPQNSYDQDQSQLLKLNHSIAVYTDLRARAQGQAQGTGDPAALAQEQTALSETLERQSRELAALNLALEALTAANAQLQSRFSPAVNHLAGQLLSRLTGGRYDALTFTREFEAMATAQGQPRPAHFLSQGTGDQTYLALRLAICLLALPGAEPGPLVLDDALVTFDDRRLALALQLLEELSRERQVLLFTCQDRERRAMAEAPFSKK